MADDYLGHVVADGPPIERLDGAVRVRKFSVEAMDNNVYVIACSRTGQALVVDAAARADRIRELTADVEVLAVVQTHGHWDHVRAWGDLRADPGWPIWGHRGDAEIFPVACDRWLEDGDRLAVGDLTVHVLHTPGHTAGGLQFRVEGAARPHLFTGDSLFPGGPGNTWGDAAKFSQLMDGLESRVFGALPDATWVYPGHGDDTTIGQQRPSLSAWRSRGW